MSNTRHIKRSILFVADTHTGSRVALFPPKWRTEKGHTIIPADEQIQIYEWWLDIIAQAKKYRVDTVIMPGDALHGLNRKEFGGGLITLSLNEQKAVCVELLRPLVRGRQFLTTDGSGYHESLDYKVHKDIAEALNGKHLGGLANLHLKGTKHILNIAHGESAAALYRTTVSERAVNLIKMAKADDRLPDITILARGHWHNYYYIDYDGFHCLQIPCWVCWHDNRIYRRYYGKMQPTIGAVILQIDTDNDIHIHKFVHKAPHIDDKVREA